MIAPMPRYERVFLQLRQRILQGEWPTERAMPGEHDLAARFGVSRITIRRALLRLEQQSLVSRRQGVGTFATPPRRPRRTLRLQGLLEEMVATGTGTELRLLGEGRVEATEGAAGLLEIAVGTPLHEVRRIRAVDGAAYAYLVSWVPEEIADRFPPGSLQTDGMSSLLLAAGAEPARAEQVISAQLADERVAEALGVPVGSALLSVRRRVRDRAGRAIHAVEGQYLPELYECRIELVRSGPEWRAEVGAALAETA